jgi:hypothetical protein
MLGRKLFSVNQIPEVTMYCIGFQNAVLEVKNLQFQFSPCMNKFHCGCRSFCNLCLAGKKDVQKKHHRLTDELLKRFFRLFQKCLQLAKSSFLEFRKTFMSSVRLKNCAGTLCIAIVQDKIKLSLKIFRLGFEKLVLQRHYMNRVTYFYTSIHGMSKWKYF